MICLVTGGGGFVGSNLVNRLVKDGHVVDVVDDLSNGQVEFFDIDQNEFPVYRTFYHMDFAEDRILDVIQDKKYDIVFHLAALPRVGYSIDHPYITNNTNVNKTVKLLEACRGNVKRFINTSSSSVYGNAYERSSVCTDEDAPHDPQSPYALQKSINEKYCRMFSKLYDMDTVSIRPFNIFGPNQKGNSPYSCAISAWLYAIKHGLPLRSDGTGEQTRDLIYVDDVVDLFVTIANSEKRFNGDAFNAGYGTSFENNELLEILKEQFPNIEVIKTPSRPGDVMHTLASITKLKQVLNWRPKHETFSSLDKTIAWAMNSELF